MIDADAKPPLSHYLMRPPGPVGADV
jgi:hypothetical protein